jgi:hypothetical protein
MNWIVSIAGAVLLLFIYSKFIAKKIIRKYLTYKKSVSKIFETDFFFHIRVE